MKENSYLIEELLLDESFQSYALGQSKKEVKIWEVWINEHPESKVTCDEAKEIIIFISRTKVKPEFQIIKERIFDRLQRQNAIDKKISPKSLKIRKFYYVYAALTVMFIGLFFATDHFFHINLFPANEKYSIVTVLTGQKGQIVLPDGSKVWLNSGTTLKYSTDFLKDTRKVFLEGEAYFDVVHKDNIPFQVCLKNNITINVLGTEFNVKSYQDDKLMEATLIKGEIKLTKNGWNDYTTSEINLKPNQKATYYKNKKITIITEIDESNSVPSASPLSENAPNNNNKNELELITSWKNETLMFQDERFEDIAIRLERWFGFKITISDELLKNEKFTGKFVNRESIFQILDIISRTEPIQYKMDGERLYITKRKNSS